MTTTSFAVGEGERRVCTIVFCDLQGSSTIAERLDPEEWAEIVNEALAAIVAPVARFEGTVARLLGDAVLAYFGAPVAHEDDPERAVLAGMEMVKAIAQLRERGDGARPELAVRVGINTGLVVLQDVRAGAAIEHTALGDVANVAARLQTIAQPGTVVVSDHTRRQIAKAFEFRGLGALELKGRASPVEAFVVTGRAAQALGARAGPLLGRDDEIATLRRAVGDLRTGRGGVVALVGDAGIGKTRLLREIDAFWHGSARTGEHAHWSESRGESYAQGLPYRLLEPHLLEMCGASETDPPDVVRAKLRRADASCCPGGACSVISAIDAGPPEKRELSLRALEMVLAVEDPSVPKVEDPQLAEEIGRVVTDAVRRHHEHGPGILVFDDLQWTDAGSVELLQRIASLTETTALLVLLAFRGDRTSAAWRFRQWLETELPHRYAEVMLGPLPDGVASALVAQLLEGATPPARDLVPEVLAKAEGNPLFIEEIVRSFQETGTMSIPDALRALLAARIDRLDERQRRVVQTAAVIGRRFAYPVLRAMVEDTDLDQRLVALERVDIVREEARLPERVFGFRHPLLQETAYASILQRRRRELHGQAARALESTYPERGEEQAALIGMHLAEAGDPSALRHLLVGAGRAIRLHTLGDALAILERASAAARTAAADRATLLDLYAKRGRVHELRAEYEEALRDYEELEKEARRLGDAGLEAEALSRRANVLTMPTRLHDPDRSKELVARAVDLARDAGEKELVARLQWSRAFGALWSGEFDLAATAALESLRLARELGLRDLEGSSLNTLSHIRRERGDLAGATEAMEQAAAIFRSLENVPMLIDSLGILAFERGLADDLEGMRAAATEAHALAERTNHDFGRADVAYYPALLSFRAAEYAEAIAILEAGLGAARRAGHVGAEVSLGGVLVRVLVEVGQVGRAATVLAEVDPPARQAGFASWLLGSAARVAFAQGRVEDARRLVAEADGPRPPFWLLGVHEARLADAAIGLATDDAAHVVDVVRAWRKELSNNGASIEAAELDWLEGEGLRRLSRVSEAIAILERSRTGASTRGERRVLWRALSSLSRAHESLGDAPSARALASSARDVLDEIESRLPVELAASFRRLPEVMDARGERAPLGSA